MSDTAALARAIEARLRAAGVARRAIHHAEGYIPSEERHYGVPVPTLRAIAREAARALRQAPGTTVLALAEALIATEVHDCRAAAYEILIMHPAAFALLNAGRLERLGAGMDNWGSVDHFARGLSGPAWQRGQISEARIDRWRRSPDRWWRRAALVSTVALNEKRHSPAGDAPRTLAVCLPLLDDRDPMVVKALSWALRALVERDRGAVQAFLDAQTGRVAPLAAREVRHKLATGLKSPRRATRERGASPRSTR